MAEPLVAIIRHQPDAVELERVERVGDFLERSLGIGEREHRPAAEAAGMIGNQLGVIFVALAHQFARRFAGREVDAGLGDRQHGDGDTGLVHVGERFFDRPAA